MGFSRNGGLSGVSDSMTLALEEHLFPNNCNPTGFFVPTKFQDLQLHMLTEEFKKKDANQSGTAVFQYEDFLRACFSIHT